MENETSDVKKSYSSDMTKNHKILQSQECKSDTNLMFFDKISSSSSKSVHDDGEKGCNDTTRDEIVVKDGSSISHTHNKNYDPGRGDVQKPNSDKPSDEIEMKILKKISRQLQTDDNSSSSLDSHFKLFKTTVNQILENFYSNVQEFEVYKKRFNEILTKNKGDSVVEMEDFIKDMIQHIGSSESSVSSRKITETKDLDDNIFICETKIGLIKERSPRNLTSTIDAFTNENYLTDSTFGQNSSKFSSDNKNERLLNIFLMNGTRYVEIKMKDRSLFSEINIRNQCSEGIKEPLASAENLKKLEAKKLELENHARSQEEERPLKFREIPVKNSNAKKNIHLDENLLHDDKDDCHRFFIFRFCNYICRKIRKNALG